MDRYIAWELAEFYLVRFDLRIWIRQELTPFY